MAQKWIALIFDYAASLINVRDIWSAAFGADDDIKSSQLFWHTQHH